MTAVKTAAPISAIQIEQIHDQLRQGWPLELAENNVAVSTGHCPLKSRRAGGGWG